MPLRLCWPLPPPPRTREGVRVPRWRQRALIAALGLATCVACAESSRSQPVLRRGGGEEANRACDRVPACVAYLENLKRKVQAIWKPRGNTPEGRVVIGMKIDGNGTPMALETVRADSPELASSCRRAIGYAEPFGMLPIGLAFLEDRYIRVEFEYRKP